MIVVDAVIPVGRTAVERQRRLAQFLLTHPLSAMQVAPQVLWLEPAQKNAFAANCISLAEGSVWMSARAADSLRPDQRLQLERAGFALRSVELDEIEKAGGSLRCCVAEIY